MTGKKMRAHYLQHVPFEGPGSIEPWLRTNGYELSSTRFFESVELPDPKSMDMLVILGGPMSVNEADEFLWLAAEKQFVREVIEAEKPVLGVCLGAQIIASAMGASVHANHAREIGWFPVHAVASAEESVFLFPPSEIVFHWHGETFDLPPGAIRLARSEGCANQAFQLGKWVSGLQFHLETTPKSARQMVAHCREELVPSPYVQTPDEILSAAPGRYQSINDLMNQVLSYLG